MGVAMSDGSLNESRGLQQAAIAEADKTVAIGPASGLFRLTDQLTALEDDRELALWLAALQHFQIRFSIGAAAEACDGHLLQIGQEFVHDPGTELLLVAHGGIGVG
jgi:hypothetical protein